MNEARRELEVWKIINRERKKRGKEQRDSDGGMDGVFYEGAGGRKVVRGEKGRRRGRRGRGYK